MPHDHAHHDHDHHHGGHKDHHHGPGGHSHAPKDFGRAFAIGAGLNIAFVAAEAAAGLITGSLALLADAGHNLSDVLGLLLAWGAVILSKRLPTGRRTYGLGKGTVLASLANAGLLMLAVGAIVWEAVRRFNDPQPIEPGLVIIVAAIGVVINTATALMFMRGHGDLNVRGAFLHMAADAAVSLGVVVAAIIIWTTGWQWIDPVISLVIAAVIVIGTWGLLRDSLDLALDAAPRGIDPEKVKAWLASRPGVTEVHDLHIWAMSTSETALTAHLTRPVNADSDAFLDSVCHDLVHEFGIGHATLQLETGAHGPCRLAAAHG
ncbi:cation diffusion facilitator family transporter [Caulobacter sp. SLTY]|uniref:cation diffusion facilitator family transporter n=1 Tax=Caulobacter sp. SLTY TaxID=2683262 RepID=UPI0014128A8C|nr:cation diffusion facilitator family transporter [Caulobacter sp. SLTY]NBB14183.1 cation diffusion facilitator family transporter [Caulobacter sp. SLTY]